MKFRKISSLEAGSSIIALLKTGASIEYIRPTRRLSIVFSTELGKYMLRVDDFKGDHAVHLFDLNRYGLREAFVFMGELENG